MIKKRNSRWSQLFLILTGLFWISVVATGFVFLEREEFTPVKNDPVAASFPPDSAIQLTSDRPTLLIFFHPLCPCSRASLRELDQLLAETPNKLSAVLIFTVPKGMPAGWEDGDLWKSATAMPEVRVLRDPEGVEARRFGVNGSGHALLFGPSGKLLFSGGITPSRGHEGDNPGRSAIVSLVLNGHALVSQTPVFGCSLL